jgi:hypothetical protein
MNASLIGVYVVDSSSDRRRAAHRRRADARRADHPLADDAERRRGGWSTTTSARSICSKICPPPLDVKTMAAGGAAVVHDAFGDVYVRRRRLGTVPVNADGSAHYAVTGGLPLVIELPPTPMSSARSLPRVIAEHVMFSPGESVHEGLRRGAFDGFCAGCHGSTSGRALCVLVPQPRLEHRRHPLGRLADDGERQAGGRGADARAVAPRTSTERTPRGQLAASCSHLLALLTRCRGGALSCRTCGRSSRGLRRPPASRRGPGSPA